MAFVRAVSDQHHVHIDKLLRRNVMCIERLVRNIGFALAAVAIVVGLGATIEYQPVINALAR
jgi:hypothetical protein